MKRIRAKINEEYEYYDIVEFIFTQCGNMPFALFLKIQFEKGLITFNELLEICQTEEKDDFELIDW